MTDQCQAFNEPAGGTCLIRCEKAEGHGGYHEGSFGTMVIGGVTQDRHRRWDDDTPQHRSKHDAVRWVHGALEAGETP